MEAPKDIPNALTQAAARCEEPVYLLWVDHQEQELILLEPSGKEGGRFQVSTAKVGLHQEEGSLGTPSGWHKVVERYGAGQPPEVLLSSRRLTGECSDPSVSADQICARVLRLSGLEPGLNSGVGCDSYRRYIYLHGTNHLEDIGTPCSQGCIRLTPDDMCHLFNLVAKTEVFVYIT